MESLCLRSVPNSAQRCIYSPQDPYFPVQQAFVDFADKECQLILRQRVEPLFFEFFDVAYRVRVRNPSAARHRRQIRFAGSRRGVTDPAAAVDTVVEDVNDQILGLQISQGRQIEQR